MCFTTVHQVKYKYIWVLTGIAINNPENLSVHVLGIFIGISEFYSTYQIPDVFFT